MSTVLELVNDQWVAPSAPKPRQLSPEDAAEHEASRVSRRQRARQQLAKCELAEQRYCELRDAIAAIEARKEALAADHQRDVAPLQNELDAIEKRQIDLIAAKLPTNPNDEQRRGELLDQLRKHNVELSEAIESQDRLRKQLGAEVELLRPQIISKPEFAAVLIATSRDDLRVNLAVAKNAAQWSESRLHAAKLKAQEFGNHWHAIVLDAQQALDSAKQREAAALSELLDE
jgi:predicted nucleotidyltransferase